MTSAGAISPTSNSSTNVARVEYVCGALKQDCSAIIEADHLPQVIVTSLQPGYLGLYWEGAPDVIFISDTIKDPVELEATIRHEMTHFLDYHYHWTGMESCATESLAWYIFNLYMIENQGQPVWDWNTSYNCPAVPVHVE